MDCAWLLFITGAQCSYVVLCLSHLSVLVSVLAPLKRVPKNTLRSVVSWWAVDLTVQYSAESELNLNSVFQNGNYVLILKMNSLTALI